MIRISCPGKDKEKKMEGKSKVKIEREPGRRVGEAKENGRKRAEREEREVFSSLVCIVKYILSQAFCVLFLLLSSFNE